MALDDRFSVDQKVVVITGASRGIGKVLAQEFADRGSRLILASRNAQEVDDVASALRQSGKEAIGLAVDISNPTEIPSFLSRAESIHNRIDVLINNAGNFRNTRAFDISEEEWEEVMNTNLKGLFFLSQCAGRIMAEEGAGRIINVSSCLARIGQSGYACYGAAKAGVEQLTRVLALEWAEHGITVNALAPTSTITETSAARLQQPELAERAVQRIPMGRFGTPDDLAGAAIFLASPASDFMTGQTLIVDGGFSL